MTTAISANAPDHFTAVAAPSEAPAANRHGRQIGDGEDCDGRSAGAVSVDASLALGSDLASAACSGAAGPGVSGGSSGSDDAASTAACRLSIHRRSRRNSTNASTIQNSRWMSSKPTRDITTFRFSTAINNPATAVHSAEPNRSCAITAVSVTTSVPATTEEIRQPNERIPNSLMPIAISHLPKGGWTHEPTSHLVVRQYFSSLESIVQVLFDQPRRMHAALG